MKEYEDAAMSGTTCDRPQYQLMLSEVGTIRPAAVIPWKTDRLGRDRFELADAKRRIRDAGCRICLIAEPTPDDSPESVLMETMPTTPSMLSIMGTRYGAMVWTGISTTSWMMR